ncbi:hypothetical protein LguiB_018829 [Lonicera macranthoides]
MQQRKLMLQLVKEGLEMAQERMKVLVDKGRSDRVFKMGDWETTTIQVSDCGFEEEHEVGI